VKREDRRIADARPRAGKLVEECPAARYERCGRRGVRDHPAQASQTRAGEARASAAAARKLRGVVAVAAYVPALLGLAGVVIGGVVSGGTQFYFARRRERGEFRSAVRLVSTDLEGARQVAQHCLGPPRRFAPERAGELDLAAWEGGRGVLALNLEPPAWRAVGEAVTAVEEFRRLLHDAPGEDERLEAHARSVSGRVDTARTALDRHTGEGLRPGRGRA
jgi:hypothetical protein